MKFVRMLFGQTMQLSDENLVTLISGKIRCSLPNADCISLLRQGVLSQKEGQFSPTKEARSWLKRQQLLLIGEKTASVMNVDNQPVQSENCTILRLSKGSNGEAAFLSPHHILAANRVSSLVERSQLRPSVTQNLSELSQTKRNSQGNDNDISDMAIDCRTRLADITGRLPKDCAGVVIDICGFDKGLQQVEFERRWPRRSAKLILRMGLEQVAELLQLQVTATGNQINNWR
ncbi:DUF6456 domain-containing protein [Maritalea sp.]|uniref:DUF6456 domain-containing protein n=1 Tax=Maritalea sp. TaxID=2003361 RepID=UPI003EF49D16